MSLRQAPALGSQRPPCGHPRPVPSHPSPAVIDSLLAVDKVDDRCLEEKRLPQHRHKTKSGQKMQRLRHKKAAVWTAQRFWLCRPPSPEGGGWWSGSTYSSVMSSILYSPTAVVTTSGTGRRCVCGNPTSGPPDPRPLGYATRWIVTSSPSHGQGVTGMGWDGGRPP